MYHKIYVIYQIKMQKTKLPHSLNSSFQKSNSRIVKTEANKRINDCSLFCLETGTSI